MVCLNCDLSVVAAICGFSSGLAAFDFVVAMFFTPFIFCFSQTWLSCTHNLCDCNIYPGYVFGCKGKVVTPNSVCAFERLFSIVSCVFLSSQSHFSRLPLDGWFIISSSHSLSVVACIIVFFSVLLHFPVCFGPQYRQPLCFLHLRISHAYLSRLYQCHAYCSHHG